MIFFEEELCSNIKKTTNKVHAILVVNKPVGITTLNFNSFELIKLFLNNKELPEYSCIKSSVNLMDLLFDDQLFELNQFTDSMKFSNFIMTRLLKNKNKEEINRFKVIFNESGKKYFMTYGSDAWMIIRDLNKSNIIDDMCAIEFLKYSPHPDRFKADYLNFKTWFYQIL